MYKIYEKVLDTRNYGLPQSRKRLYIVGIQKNAMMAAFRFPKPVGYLVPARKLLVPPKQDATSLSEGHLRRLLPSLESLDDPFQKVYFIDIDGSPKYRGRPKENVCPCLTRTRAGTGGFWVTSIANRMGTRSIAKFQGFDLDKVDTSMVSDRQLRLMLGNAWSINVSSWITYNLMRSLGESKIVMREPSV